MNAREVGVLARLIHSRVEPLQPGVTAGLAASPSAYRVLLSRVWSRALAHPEVGPAIAAASATAWEDGGRFADGWGAGARS